MRLRGKIDLFSVDRTTRTLLKALRSLPDALEIDLSSVDHLSWDGALAFVVVR